MRILPCCGGGRWCDRLPDVFVIPRQIALPTISLVTRPLDTMKLVWIDYELSVYAKSLQGLIHLFASLNRDIEVALTTHEERRCLNAVGMKERI